MRNDVTVTVVEYNMGNIGSVENALNVVAKNVEVVSHGDKLGTPDAIVVPGVGSFAEGIDKLRERCFIDPLADLVVDKGTPYLGICLGLQFLVDGSEEGGYHEGFGWIPGTVTQVKPEEQGFNVPHMGWNSTKIESEDDTMIFREFKASGTFYYVHSYHLDPATTDGSVVVARTWHGTDVTAAVRMNNIFGVQFHPEKSQGAGLKLLENFVAFANGSDAPSSRNA